MFKFLTQPTITRFFFPHLPPNQRVTLDKLPTELRDRNFLNEHRPSTQTGAKMCKNVRATRMRSDRASIFFFCKLVVGWLVSWWLGKKTKLPSPSTHCRRSSPWSWSPRPWWRRPCTCRSPTSPTSGAAAWWRGGDRSDRRRGPVGRTKKKR